MDRMKAKHWFYLFATISAAVTAGMGAATTFTHTPPATPDSVTVVQMPEVLVEQMTAIITALENRGEVLVTVEVDVRPLVRAVRASTVIRDSLLYRQAAAMEAIAAEIDPYEIYMRYEHDPRRAERQHAQPDTTGPEPAGND